MFKISIGAVNINIHVYELVSPPLLKILQHSGHFKIVLQCLNKCKHYICAVNLVFAYSAFCLLYQKEGTFID